MTPQEIAAALKKIRDEAGINAWCDVAINPDRYDEKCVVAVLYPFGITKSDQMYVRVDADTFEDVIRLLRETWEARKAAHHVETVRKMALTIIRITDEVGSCTDAALRNEFDAGLVEKLSELACERANEIAGKGPFKVQRTRKSNAA